MNGLETKMTVDALKPASGLIDALLAPKVERLKKWAQDRDLETYLKNDGKLTDLLEDYIIRLFKRASEISTLVFPQEKIPLAALYEPVSLTRHERAIGGERDDKYIIDLSHQGQCLFIIDDAGMGKSTFAKYLCTKIFEKTDQVPILFDLADYSKDKNLIDNLAHELDDIDRGFDRQLFKKLILKGHFFVILDGYDEAPNEIQEKISLEIKQFNEKKGLSSIVVTSRPQERLPNLTGAITLRLKLLSKEQASNIFVKYDKLSKLDIGKNLIEEIERIPERFLQTPLLVGLLYRTYGFNNAIAEKITVFYSEIYDALYKGHDLTKSGYVREKASKLDVDSFRNLLRAFSFLYIAKTSEIKQTFEDFLKLIDEARKLCTLPQTNSRDFLNDLLIAVPLLTRDGLTLKFMHRSIAEYFAGEYIVSRGDARDFLTKLVSGRSRSKFKETIEYIQELSPSLYNEVVVMPMAQQYLELYKQGENGIYETLSFTKHWGISIWILEEVQSEDQISLPLPPFPGVQSQSYMYGKKSGVEYIVSLAEADKNTISGGTWDELGEILFGSEQNLDFRCIFSDKNIEVFLSVLDVGKWYENGMDEVAQLKNTSALKELMARAIDMRSRRKKDLVEEANSVKILSPERCRSLIDSIKELSEAETSIAEIIGIL
jgi:hypothetical protein